MNASSDLTRIVFSVLFLGALIVATFWITKPFLGALIWATAIVVTTWPAMLRLEKWLQGRRWLAAGIMTIALLMIFIVPLAVTIGTVIGNAEEISVLARTIAAIRLPLPPDWVITLPLVGEKISTLWLQFATISEAEIAAKISPYSGMLLRWLASKAGGFGLMLVEFLLTAIIAAILYSTGEQAVQYLRRFSRRLAGARGEGMIHHAAQAVRGVALGVVLTALIQALFGGIGLAMTGVPFVAVLTGVMFMLAIAQIGTLPVLVPAIIWLYWKDASGAATALLVLAVLVSSLDNVIRPMLIRRGADLPLLLIFSGVIGGLIAFGLIGIFVGPVVLAVAYKLLEAWLAEDTLENNV